MAAYTATQHGNIDTAATFGGAGIPGDGDTVAAAGYNVVVNVDTVIGTDPAVPANVLTVADGGSITIAAGVSFTVKGEISTNNSLFTMEAGSSLIINAVTAGQTYHADIGVSDDPLASFVANGTALNPCTITATGAGIVSFDHYVSTSSGEFKCYWTDFNHVGSDSVQCVRGRRDLQFRYCRFDDCGVIDCTTVDADKNLDFYYCNWKNSPGVYNLSVGASTVPGVDKLRRIVGNSFDKRTRLFEMREVDITDNFFGQEFDHPATSTYLPKSWDRNFHVKTNDLAPRVALMKDCFLYWPDADNYHLGIRDMSQTFDGWVIECAVEWGIENNENDFALVEPSATPPAGTIIEVKNCLNLPISTGSGNSSSTLFTSDGHDTVVYRVRNNTFCAQKQGAGLLADDHVGVAGSIEYFKNNLGWAPPGATRAELLQSDHVPPESIADDYITMADYNGRWGLTATDYEDVSANAFAAIPGAHDLRANPMFVDSTRNLATYASTVLGYTGDTATLHASLLRALGSMNDPDSADYKVGLTPLSVIEWIREGFAPTNALYATAADDGSWIGAVEPVISASGAISMMMMPF